MNMATATKKKPAKKQSTAVAKVATGGTAVRDLSDDAKEMGAFDARIVKSLSSSESTQHTLEKARKELATVHPDLYEKCYLPTYADKAVGDRDTMQRIWRMGYRLNVANTMNAESGVAALAKQFSITEGLARKAMHFAAQKTQAEAIELVDQGMYWSTYRHLVDLSASKQKQFLALAIKHRLSERDLVKKLQEHFRGDAVRNGDSKPRSLHGGINQALTLTNRYISARNDYWQEDVFAKLDSEKSPDGEFIQDVERLCTATEQLAKSAQTDAKALRAKLDKLRKMTGNDAGDFDDDDADDVDDDDVPVTPRAPAAPTRGASSLLSSRR